VEFSHITTRGGDEGKTSLINGERRYKDELVFEVLGGLDELSSYLGLARAGAGVADFRGSSELSIRLHIIQKKLIVLGGQVATPPPLKATSSIEQADVDELEAWQMSLMDDLLIKQFIIPGATELSARLDLARAVARRTERHMVHFIRTSHALGFEAAGRWINRLSDFLFVAARDVVPKVSSDDY